MNLRWLLACFFLAIVAASFLTFSTARAAPPPVSAYAQLPAVYDGALSPDGKKLAVILENDGVYILRVFNLADPSDKTIRATAIPQTAVPLWIKWANNDRILLSLEGTEVIETTIVNTGFLMTMSGDLKKAELLIKPPRNRRANSRLGAELIGVRQFNNVVVDFLYDDPNHILMSFSDKDASEPDVQKVNVKNGKYKKIRTGGANIDWWTTDLRGEVRVAQGRAEFGDGFVLTVRDADGDDWKSYREYDGLEADENIMGFTEDPNELIVARYNGENTLGLFVYDLRTQAITRKLFQHPSYDVNNIVLSADGKRVIGAKYIADTPETVFFDEAAKARIEQIETKLKGYVLSFIDQTPDGSKVLLRAYAPDYPASLILYDFNKGKWMNMGSNYPQLSGVEHAHVQAVKYTSRDGQTIPGYVTLPRKVLDAGGIKDVPFIIMPHGGPYARDFARFDYMTQFFASRGYGVLQMNFRGSAGYGKDFQEAGRKSWITMQEDVTDGAKWLVEKGYADKDRICIVGWSYGGYAALMGAVKHSDMYQCAASIAGVTDLGDLIEDMEKYSFGDKFAREMIKDGFDSKSEMRENSPVKQVDAISIPIFLAHGTKDVNVHFDHFQAMKRALKRHKNVVALELEGANHSVMDSQNRIKMFEALEAFVIEHLGESSFAQ